jgi:hypothetical protein
MRGSKRHGAVEQRIQFSRGHWRREEAAGAIRSAGSWESVTVTWSPVESGTARGRRPGLLRQALSTAAETIVPAIAEAVASRAVRSIDRRALVRGTRRILPAGPRALPRSERAR